MLYIGINVENTNELTYFFANVEPTKPLMTPKDKSFLKIILKPKNILSTNIPNMILYYLVFKMSNAPTRNVPSTTTPRLKPKSFKIRRRQHEISAFMC